MIRNIVVLILICILCYAGYEFYKQHQANAKLDSGDVTCQGCESPEEHARFLRENSGDTPDGNSEHKDATARVAAKEAYLGTGSTASPVDSSNTTTSSTGTSSMQAPAQSGYAVGTGNVTSTPPPVVVPTTPSPNAQPVGAAPTYAAAPSYTQGLPTTDSVPANPTNGYRFSGSGPYQWYRQGNLTWRVDTTTGRSCIIYATMEEWRKAIVMSHGCGKAA